uniref:Uncharacterized protein n=1 Tax=Kalanchoe fedtschenkoi TaxID=63787 RepID=A0A7N0ZSE9_KALFE
MCIYICPSSDQKQPVLEMSLLEFSLLIFVDRYMLMNEICWGVMNKVSTYELMVEGCFPYYYKCRGLW